MIRSCKSCKTKCCKTGPNPDTPLQPDVYVDRFGTHEGYNTRCQELTNKGHCELWGTPDLPIECRTYVCFSRVFSEKELVDINNVTDEVSCPNCSCGWVFEIKSYLYKCEVCDCEFQWKSKILKQGKPQA